MKKINSLFHSLLAVLLVFALIIVNLSFTFSEKYIEIPGLDKIDLSTSACYCVELPDGSYKSIRSEKPTRIHGVDNCQVGLHLPGFMDPNTGKFAPMHTKNSKRDVAVKFIQINYILPQPTRLKVKEQSEDGNHHEDYSLRFMAVSAPQWVSGGNIADSYALGSRVPFSLQNAVRLGARDALKEGTVWSQSNWSQKSLLKDSVFLLNYYDEEKFVFADKLMSVKPQVLFIGSMTLPFPAAIELAKLAKQKFGNNIFTVLGGKHAIETIYLSQGEVKHHHGSATLLMQRGDIPQVFDLVVSGDGEEVIQKIGEVIGNEILNGNSIQNFSSYKNNFESIRGNFILSWIDDAEIQTLVKQNNPLDYPSLPSPISLFGTTSSFPVFSKELTAHIYSDMGKGCVCSCFFCSEGLRINGPVVQSGSPASRLYKQLKDASEQGPSMSAFIEDSIILMGSPKHLNELADRLEQNPLNIVFGGQFTVDNLTNPKIQEAIIRLKNVGLTYIYTGMETINEDKAMAMSKNVHKGESWLERTEAAVSFVTNSGIKHGLSILWGLGETAEDRVHQLEVVATWQKRFNNPVVVSPNWATQHPLFDQSSFDYTSWGTNKASPYLPYFVQLFGEAAEKYKLSGTELPEIDELKRLLNKFEVLNIQNI